jgi:uncharacterized protein YcfL
LVISILQEEHKKPNTKIYNFRDATSQARTALTSNTQRDVELHYWLFPYPRQNMTKESKQDKAKYHLQK